VQRGTLGDCWFIGTLAAIAEWSDRTKLMFRNKSYTDQASKNGVFEVTMWMYGSPLKVVVDDKLLLRNRFYPAFAKKSENGAWWVPIIEKAAAKYYGTYEDLDGGEADQAFYALTGMPSVKLIHSEWTLEKAWTNINYYDNSNFVM
jgi:hypothetical protein